MKKEIMHYLLIGYMTALPVYILAEYIRYGFISHYFPLWALALVPVFFIFGVEKDARLGLIWRMMLFVWYTVIGLLLISRGLAHDGLLLAVLVIGFAYAMFALFQVAGRR